MAVSGGMTTLALVRNTEDDESLLNDTAIQKTDIILPVFLSL